MANSNSPIGVFDSGFGGLTVFRSIIQQLPHYDYIYLGDNARSPYGDHSFETVYQYTWESVEWLLKQGCKLVILACNTASAKALRSIQQGSLLKKYPDRRVLGVIRPTAEVIGHYTKTNNIGVLGTKGTIASGSYPLEIARFFPKLNVYQQACPLFVPMIENGEHLGDGIDYFIKQYLSKLMEQNQTIDSILLACTHYPLLIPKLQKYLDGNIKLVSQGDIVADSLTDYLQRHTEIQTGLSQNGKRQFYTSGSTLTFNQQGSVFLGEKICASHTSLLPIKPD